MNEELPAIVRLELKGNQIARLTDTKSNHELKGISLPAEMLSADFDSRRQTRRAVSLDELPPSLIQALLAAEDQRFFSHPGIDFKGIVRAFFHNLRLGRIGQGASTLTQQLVKNHFLTPERTYTRKLNEITMALALEQQLTKYQILSLYCDRVYLGHSGITSVYGFKQGAHVYFGKNLKDLTVSESALLVGLIKAPNRYSPYVNQASAKARRDLVLRKMAEAGSLSQEQSESARSEPLAVLAPQPVDAMSAPYFIDYVRRSLHTLNCQEYLQIRVETTLDMDLQQAANEVVQKHLQQLGKRLSTRRKSVQPEAALLALNTKTGDILAMTGGRDYSSSQLNRVTDAHRQPGSVFKPVVYAAALSQGILPSTTFLNAPQEFASGQTVAYRPQNFGHSYTHQPVMFREALVRSLNVVSVAAALQTGLSNVANMAEKMGLPRPESYPSMALGAFEATPLEIASAYTTFANQGTQVAPNAIRRVSRQGMIEAEPLPTKTRVISPTAAYLVTDALADVVNRGTASRVRKMGYRGAVAGKTGTSRDAWFVGYTPNLLVVVWVGQDNNEDLHTTGGDAAVPLWTDFLLRISQLRPDLTGGTFAVPAGMEMVGVCSTSGGQATEYCLQQQKIRLPAAILPPPCNVHEAPLPLSDAEIVESELFKTEFTNETDSMSRAAKNKLEQMNWGLRE